MNKLWQAALSMLQSTSDEEAMRRVRVTGDHHEFEHLVRKWEEPIRRLCTRLTGDSGRGEELKQETFLRLFKTRESYEPSARFSTFLWRIALNLCHDEFRRQERHRQFTRGMEGNENCEPASETPGPDAQAVAFEESELVRAAVLGLPEIYRAVVVLRHYEGLKLTRIAEILQVPEGTVNSRMAEALTRLNRALEPKLRRPPATLHSPTVLTLKNTAIYESSKP